MADKKVLTVLTKEEAEKITADKLKADITAHNEMSLYAVTPSYIGGHKDCIGLILNKETNEVEAEFKSLYEVKMYLCLRHMYDLIKPGIPFAEIKSDWNEGYVELYYNAYDENVFWLLKHEDFEYENYLFNTDIYLRKMYKGRRGGFFLKDNDDIIENLGLFEYVNYEYDDMVKDINRFGASVKPMDLFYFKEFVPSNEDDTYGFNVGTIVSYLNHDVICCLYDMEALKTFALITVLYSIELVRDFKLIQSDYASGKLKVKEGRDGMRYIWYKDISYEVAINVEYAGPTFDSDVIEKILG